MPLYDFVCEECGSKFTDYASSDDMSDEYRHECTVCKQTSGVRWFLNAPFVQYGGEGSVQQIQRMQKSFKNRFYKKGIDDVRQKHGKAIDDSLRGAELEKIKGTVKK